LENKVFTSLVNAKIDVDDIIKELTQDVTAPVEQPE